MNPVISSIAASLLIDRRDGHRKKVLDAFKVKKAFDYELDAVRMARQNEALASLLQLARTAVPFYRDHLNRCHEIEPQNARAILATLPIITRADIQRDPDAFRSSLTESAYPDATGGSSGTPMRFWVDRQTQQQRESSLYWSDSLAGWEYGERIAMLWGSDKDVRSASQRARMQVRWRLDNRRWYNAFNMGESQMAEFHRQMTRFRPHIIVAYAGSMEIYARFLESSKLMPNYPIKSIVCSAEVLTLQAREVIDRVFPCPVYNRYGNREFGAIATECSEHQGLHINERDCVIEIKSPDSRTIAGNLIVTYLHNKAMPFLRYNTGDMVTSHSETACRCGRLSSRLSGITGRESDTIRTGSGNLIHGEYFTHLLYAARRVREFQFIQEKINQYRLLLVADGREDAATENSLRSQILDEVGHEAGLEIEYVDHIPVLPSGKRKFTLSRLNEENQSKQSAK